MNVNLFERILVPTEMDESGDLALRYALLFNRRLGSKLTLLHAAEISWLAHEHPVGYYFHSVEEARFELELRLREFANRYVPESADVSTVFVDDDPPRAIAKTATEIRADLIVMSTHGRHGFRRVLLGSVAERVLRESDVPVLTLRPDLARRASTIAIRTVLCPINFTDTARSALEEATAIAEAFDAELVLMHVRENGLEPGEASVESQFSNWVDPLIRKSTQYRAIVVDGDAAASVLETADQMRDTLLVIGAQHRRFSNATIIGTTTERLTRFARLPVITVIRKAVEADQTADMAVAAV
jgi:nucleotide-binding universal stress UspA family protein